MLIQPCKFKDDQPSKLASEIPTDQSSELKVNQSSEEKVAESSEVMNVTAMFNQATITAAASKVDFDQQGFGQQYRRSEGKGRPLCVNVAYSCVNACGMQYSCFV